MWRGAKQMAAFWCFCRESTSLHVTTGTDIYSGFLLVLYNRILSFFNINLPSYSSNLAYLFCFYFDTCLVLLILFCLYVLLLLLLLVCYTVLLAILLVILSCLFS
jgi:hypothetical protein